MRFRGTAIVVACLALAGCSSERREFVAQVNGQNILPGEFTVRYAQYLADVGARDNILLRKQILNNMINEILIREELALRGLDRDSLARTRSEEIRLQALLLRYAQRSTLDTMTVTEEEIGKEFDRYSTRVAARYVYAPTEDEAWQLKERLEQGATFDQIARTVFDDPGLATSGGYLGFFGWGEMEPPLEEVAYTLPVGALSDPVKLRMGYAIVRVEERVRQPMTTETDFAKVKEELLTAIEKRKVTNILTLSAEKIKRELHPLFDEPTLRDFSEALGVEGKLRLNVEQAHNYPAGLLERKLVEFSGASWTVGVALEKMRSTTARQQRRVRSAEDVKTFIVGLAVREVTMRNALNAHLDQDSVVLDQISRKKTEFLLNRWKSDVQDTVTAERWDEPSLRAVYNARKTEYIAPDEINVAEILVRTQPEASRIMNDLARGADFAAIARKKSIRLRAAKQGGELGFGPRSMYGILAETLFNAPVGKPLGPLEVNPYFGVFKVVGKRPRRQQTFDEARPTIALELTSAAKAHAMRKAVDRLREGATVVVNEEILANIVIN